MEDEQSRGLTQNFYGTAFSAREKRILSELFGPGYPKKDLPPKSVLKIVSKFQSSVVEKLKVSSVLQHILKYFVLVESEKVELADDTTSDGQRAVILLDALSYKGSYAIGALYLALLDSSNESFGPPTHYQLAHELKRIVQEECSISASLSLLECSHTNTEDNRQMLEQLIDGFADVCISEEQEKDLCIMLGIAYTFKVVKLDLLCKEWIRRKGTWVQLLDLVEALLLCHGLGKYTANLMLPAYPSLRTFLEGLKSDWKLVALYIGFSESELSFICSSHQNISSQLTQFLKLWKVPDCGQKTSIILQKLKNASGIQILQSSTSMNKATGSSSVGLSLIANSSSVTGVSGKLHSSVPSSPYSKGLELNIIRTTEIIPTAVKATTHSITDSGDKMFVETDSLDSSSRSPEGSQQTSPFEKFSVSESVEVGPDILSLKIINSSNTSSYNDTENTYGINDFNSNVDEGGTATICSTGVDEEIMTSNTTLLNTFTSEHHSKSFEETSDITEPAEQVPSHSLTVSEEIQGYMVITTKPVIAADHEEMCSDKNLEVTPYSASYPLESVSNPTLDLKMELDKYYTPMDFGNNSVTPREEITTTIDRTQMGEDPVHDAVMKDDIHTLKALIELDVKCDSKRKSDGKTPLHIACFLGHAQNVKLLLPKVTNINSKDKDGNHCLHYESTLQCQALVSLLLEHFVLIDPTNMQFFTPLAIVSEIGDALIETARLLLASEALVNGSPKCHTTPLLLACEKGHVGIASLLLSANANVNIKDSKTGETPVMKACVHGNVEIVKLLMEYKPDLSLGNRAGITPIGMAVIKGSLEILHVLVESGVETADVNCTRMASDSRGHEYNVTPLCDAFIRGEIDISRYLIDHGANVNTTDRNNQAPDKHRGSISPLSFACMTDQDQIALVEYVVSLNQFITGLPFIADPIQEALKRGHNRSAMLLCEKYGGMEKIKLDASKMKHFELARMLNVVLTTYKEDSAGQSSDRKHGTSFVETPLESLKCADDGKQLHSVSSFTARHKEPLQPENDFSKGGITSHAQSTKSASLSLQQELTISGNTESLYNNFDASVDSDASTELTLGDDKTEPTVLNMTEQGSGLETVVIPLNEINEEVKNAVEENLELLKDVTSTNTKGTLFSQLKGSAMNISDDDNPFKPQPKTPVSELSAAESDVGGFGSSAAASAMPLRLDEGGSLQLFQGSAVEVLYDFMQYLISACLQQRTPEEVIHKAEINGDTKLVHFFTRYFFDMGNVGSHQLVSEFLQGFPSPMNFIFVSNFCSKESFLTVLKNIGREDFPDQLMLALHQFPNSDNIPWSGPALIDALFNQLFIVGSHSSMSSHATATTHSVTSESYNEPVQMETDDMLSNEFPGGGYRLGNSAELSGIHSCESKHTADSVSNGNEINYLDAATDVSMRMLQNDLSMNNDQSDMETKNYRTTQTVSSMEISRELSFDSSEVSMSVCQSTSLQLETSIFQQERSLPPSPSKPPGSLSVPTDTVVSFAPLGPSVPFLPSNTLGSSVSPGPLVSTMLPLHKVIPPERSVPLKLSVSPDPLPLSSLALPESTFSLEVSVNSIASFTEGVTFTSTETSYPLNSFISTGSLKRVDRLVHSETSLPPVITNHLGPQMVTGSLVLHEQPVSVAPYIPPVPSLIPSTLVFPILSDYPGQSVVIPTATVPLLPSVSVVSSVQSKPVGTSVSHGLPPEPFINRSSVCSIHVGSNESSTSTAKYFSVATQRTLGSLPPVYSSQPLASVVTVYQQSPIVTSESKSNFIASSGSHFMAPAVETNIASGMHLENERLAKIDHNPITTTISSHGLASVISSGSMQSNIPYNYSEENVSKYSIGKACTSTDDDDDVPSIKTSSQQRLRIILSTTDSEEDILSRNKPNITRHDINDGGGIVLRRLSYSESDEEDTTVSVITRSHGNTSLDSNAEKSRMHSAHMVQQPMQNSQVNLNTMTMKDLSNTRTQRSQQKVFVSKIPRCVHSYSMLKGRQSPKQKVKVPTTHLKEVEASPKKLKVPSVSSMKQLERSVLQPNKKVSKSVYKASQTDDGVIQNSTILLKGEGRKKAASNKKHLHSKELPFRNEEIGNTEILFRNLSTGIMNWKMLGRYLLISDDYIDLIAKQTASEQERSLQILMKWRSQLTKGNAVTYKLLYDALVNSRNDRLIRKLSEHYSVSSNADPFHSSCSLPFVSTDDLSICVPLSEFWDNLKPFIESKRAKGFYHVTINMKFQK